MTESQIKFVECVKDIGRVRFQKGESLSREKIKDLAKKWGQKDIRHLEKISCELNKEITKKIREEGFNEDKMGEDRQEEIINKALKSLAKSKVK